MHLCSSNLATSVWLRSQRGWLQDSLPVNYKTQGCLCLKKKKKLMHLKETMNDFVNVNYNNACHYK